MLSGKAEESRARPRGMQSRKARIWRILPAAPTLGFSPLPPVQSAHLERVLWVDLTRSPHRLAMTAICAKLPLRSTLQIAVFNRNRVLLSPVGPDTPRRLGWMIGAARDCSRARKRVARRKRSLDRLVECAFSLRTPFTPRPLRCLPHAKSLPCLRLAAQLAKRRWVRVREEASRSEAVKAAAFAKVGDDRFLRAAHGWYRREADVRRDNQDQSRDNQDENVPPRG